MGCCPLDQSMSQRATASRIQGPGTEWDWVAEEATISRESLVVEGSTELTKGNLQSKCRSFWGIIVTHGYELIIDLGL